MPPHPSHHQQQHHHQSHCPHRLSHLPATPSLSFTVMAQLGHGRCKRRANDHDLMKLLKGMPAHDLPLTCYESVRLKGNVLFGSPLRSCCRDTNGRALGSSRSLMAVVPQGKYPIAFKRPHD
ncbi:hypothetical protein E2C01_029871 [Portunus trituberculatus]|uniref:Uncharacterized protein n=1 Tax=Portunus trituberculatus TaxID=210409 RepID=A0A5B7EVR2_PORTR|nr:hypothetical protein [Portunus trituberculatus]